LADMQKGTSACPNGVFYCPNEGHVGASIRSSSVNDGLCGGCLPWLAFEFV
jgi:hypothetical protein